MRVDKILIYSLLSIFATVNSSNKIALTFDTQCITACTGSPNEETSTNAISPLPTSCQIIKKRSSNSPSGVYLIGNKESTTLTRYVYCHMEELCGSDEGWTRIAYLDMSNPSQSCPSGFKMYEPGGVRVCGRPVSSGGSCASVKFPSNGISYSEVCGRVVGYAYTSPDAVDRLNGPTQHNDINSFYVDGISITHGTPRKHIWTFMAGLSENNNYANGRYTCPCQQGSQQAANLQSFIGNDYFCEAGLPTDYKDTQVLRTSDPLWDGRQCGPLEQPCCNVTGLPWFHKTLSSMTEDDIELRVCCDQGTGNEDVPYSEFEIFVKNA